MICDMLTGFLCNAAGDGPGAEIICQNEGTIEAVGGSYLVCPSCARFMAKEDLLTPKGLAQLAALTTSEAAEGGPIFAEKRE